MIETAVWRCVPCGFVEPTPAFRLGSVGPMRYCQHCGQPMVTERIYLPSQPTVSVTVTVPVP